MIFSLVAMTGLEKCCITSAYLQWLCHSGEWPVAHGPLVSTSFFAKCLNVGEDGPGWLASMSYWHISSHKPQSENLSPVKTWKSKNRKQNIVESSLSSSWGWSGVAKMSYSLRHRASNWYWHSWARPAILVAGKSRGGMFLFFLFLLLSFLFLFLPCPSLSSPLLSLLSLSHFTKWSTKVDVSFKPQHNQIIIIIRFFYYCAGTGATSTSVGPLPGSWLAARMADLTPDLQVCLSWGLIAESFHSLWSLSVSCFLVILGLHQPVCHRLSWLYHWSIPRVPTSGTFSPSGWGPDPQLRK